MSDQEINIAIAEACGWTDCSKAEGNLCGLPKGVTSLNGRYELIPNYCSDLNAMHEAEKTLLFNRRIEFREQLRGVISKNLRANVVVTVDACVHAIALQRAEAFLRTLGKWEGAK